MSITKICKIVKYSIGQVKEYFECYEHPENKQNVKNGFYESYYEDSKKREEGNYENGKKNGKWISYYQNGVIKSEGTYDCNQREGRHVFYKKMA